MVNIGASKRPDTRFQRECRFTKSDGKHCRARPMTDTHFCFFHDPHVSVRRAQARSAGGRKNKGAVLPTDTPTCSLGSVQDVVLLLAETINQVRRGELDARAANNIGYLSTVLLKALDATNLERRIAGLENAVSDKSPIQQFFPGDEFEFVPATESGEKSCTQGLTGS
jgi:hypothetical protein